MITRISKNQFTKSLHETCRDLESQLWEQSDEIAVCLLDHYDTVSDNEAGLSSYQTYLNERRFILVKLLNAIGELKTQGK